MRKDTHSPLGFIDNERLEYDRCCRFLVDATHRPGSIFSKFGLIGRATRLGLQAGRASAEIENDIFSRYESYRSHMEALPGEFWQTTDRLITAYRETTFRRWQVLKD